MKNIHKVLSFKTKVILSLIGGLAFYFIIWAQEDVPDLNFPSEPPPGFDPGSSSQEILSPPPPSPPSEVQNNPSAEGMGVDPLVSSPPISGAAPSFQEDPMELDLPTAVKSGVPDQGLESMKSDTNLNSLVNKALSQQTENFLEPYNYDGKDRRDPFSWNFEEDMKGGEGDSSLLLKSQRFDLKQFRLVGILWDVANPRAMFLDPNKELHILKKNDRIGKKNGYIGFIREGEAVVVEQTDTKGKLAFKSTILPIER